MILTALTNLSTPLFFGGLAIVIASIIAAVAFLGCMSDHKALSDMWLIHQQRVKVALSTLVFGFCSIVLSYAVHDLNRPLIEQVEVEKEVIVKPDLERLYDECIEDAEIRHLRAERVSEKQRIIESCTASSVELYASMTDQPVKTIFEDRVIYRQLPYAKFMEACAPSSGLKLSGDIPINNMHEQVLKCQQLAVNEMKGLVEGPK